MGRKKRLCKEKNEDLKQQEIKTFMYRERNERTSELLTLHLAPPQRCLHGPLDQAPNSPCWVHHGQPWLFCPARLTGGTSAEVAQEAQRLQTKRKVAAQPWMLTTQRRKGEAFSLLPPGTKDALLSLHMNSVRPRLPDRWFIKEEMVTSYLVPAFSKSTSLRNGNRISVFIRMSEEGMCPSLTF